MKKNTKGILWIVLPFLALPLILTAWAFLSFFFSSVLATQEVPSAQGLMTIRIVNMVLGFLGIASIIMVPVGLIVGIVTLAKKEPVPQGMPLQEPPVQPPQEPPIEPTQQTPA